MVAEQEHLRGKPAPDTFLAGGPGTRAGAGGTRRCSRTRWPGSRPGAPDGSASWSGWTGPGRPAELKAHGADVVVADLAELLDRPRDQASGVHASSRGACGRPSWTWSCWPRPSRCSRCPTATSAGAATWTRESRTACRARYLNGVYEVRPLPYAEAGYGVPGVRADGHQRDQRQADPPARRRRAVRRPLRRAARPRAGARLPGRRAAAARAEWASPAGRVGPGRRRPGWCPSRSERSRRSATRWSRSTARRGWSCSPSCVANEQLPAPDGDPRAAAVLEAPLGRRVCRRQGTRAVLVHSTGAAACGSPRRWTTSSTGPATGAGRTRAFPDLRPW